MQAPKREASHPLLKRVGEGHVGGSAKHGHGDQCTWQWQHWVVKEGAIGEVSTLSQKQAVRSMEMAKTKLRKKARKRERTLSERCLQSWVRNGVRAG